MPILPPNLPGRQKGQDSCGRIFYQSIRWKCSVCFFTKQPAPLFWSKILKFPRCWFQRIIIASAEIFVWQNAKLKYLCKIFSQSVYAGCSKDRTSQHSDSRSLPQHPFVTGLQCWSSLIQLRDSAGFTPDFPIKPRIINPTSTQF